MATIAIANLKGGVGKSTLAVNLAGALAPGTALVDADPQATAETWAASGGLPFDVLTAPLDGGNVEEWLSQLIVLGGTMRDVVVDLPPMLGEATAAALAMADVVIIPVTPSGADLAATNRAVQLLTQAREARSGDLPLALLVPSKVDRRTAAGAEIEAALMEYGEPVGPVIAQRVAQADAFAAGQWIGDYAPGSAAHGDVKALAAVVRRLVKRAAKARG